VSAWFAGLDENVSPDLARGKGPRSADRHRSLEDRRK
jgi:hypothetical protein